LAIIFNSQQGSRFKTDRQRNEKQGVVVNNILKSRLAFDVVVFSFSNGLASHTINQKPEMVKADSGLLLSELAGGFHESDAGDTFSQWLRDEKSVRIDWGAFGIEKIHSQGSRQIQSGPFTFSFRED
jgi:hypothetical protein